MHVFSNSTCQSRRIAVILLFIYACYLVFQFKLHVLEYKVAKRILLIVREDAATIKQAKEQENQLKLLVISAIITLAILTIFVAFCSKFIVSSINSIIKGGAISKTFVRLILLPIVRNAAEHAIAITVAYKDKIDLSISIAIGFSIQIGLFVLLLIVILSQAIGKDCINLCFNSFPITALPVAVLLVNYLI